MPSPKSARRWTLQQAVGGLEKIYGRPRRAALTDPFEMAIWENVAYLVDDARRAEVFERLRGQVGLTPEAILGAPDAVLVEAIRKGGMRPVDRAAKLRRCAEIAVGIGLESLRQSARTDPVGSRKLLKRFPGVGDPGADNILLHNRSLVTLAPESNILRVLVRLGFGHRKKDYARTYRSAAEAVTPELPQDFSWLLRARELLRRHGQVICKRRNPCCETCPLSVRCVAFRAKSFDWF